MHHQYEINYSRTCHSLRLFATLLILGTEPVSLRFDNQELDAWGCKGDYIFS